MRNIFLLYMPPGNLEAMTHYRDTIQQKVAFDRISKFLSRDAASRLKRVFGERPIAVWGSRDTGANRAKFDKMAEGDDLLIVEGGTIRLLGKVALKMVNPELSRELWRNIKPTREEGWDLIYFIANPLEIGVPFKKFCRLLGYEQNYQLRGFTTVSSAKLEAFYDQYDDLYSVLVRIKAGEVVETKDVPGLNTPPLPESSVEIDPEDIAQIIDSSTVSDHVKMQWKLAALGLKAGEKIWVPPADQGKIRDTFAFNEFEPQFAAGIDLPKNYFENIDVVWKEEFRIDAAFEVENSTAIYSGLLRFADLNIVAPNTTYPMFIVAPAERRNRVREQLMRPVFKRLDLRRKVRFLPYETIDEIEEFFESSTAGLSVELVTGRSETFE